MLTYVEIDGFKSFRGLKLELQPFTVIAGLNATGKSNFFDALKLLAALATHDVGEAFRSARGEPSELFGQFTDLRSNPKIRFAAELLVPASVEDAFGQKKELNYTRLRYELELERRKDEFGEIDRIYVAKEEARIIKRADDKWLNGHPNPAPAFVKTYAKYSKGGIRTAFLETEADNFKINQDGTSGRSRRLPRDKATATVLSQITSLNEFPHLFALQKEISSLTMLQLEGTAGREPVDALGPDELLADGSNIARVLARIEAETKDIDRPKGDLIFIRNKLVSLIPGIQDIDIERDSRRYSLKIRMNDEMSFSSRVISDGTMRILALLTFLFDPKRRSVLLFEEPENGVHESRVAKLIATLREACIDIAEPDPTQRIFQVIVNTHSPAVLSETKAHELVSVDMVSFIDPESKQVLRRTRMRTGIISPSQTEFEFGDRDRRLTKAEVVRILRSDEGVSA